MVCKRYTLSHTHLSCLASTCKLAWNCACWLIVDFKFTYLAISSCTTLVESWAPRKFILAHASILFNPGHTRVKSGSHPDWYPGHRVIWVSSSDPVTTLMHNNFMEWYSWTEKYEGIYRVHNLKNQLLQIDSPTIVEWSWWYPIARSTMKPDVWLLSFRFQYLMRRKIYF